MKNLCLIIILFGILSKPVLSQDTLKAGSHKLMTELNVNLIQGQISLNNSLRQVKFRYMAKNDLAIRLGFTANYNKDNQHANQTYGTNPYANNDNRSSFEAGINAGFEKHLKGTKRLSPYFGTELSFGFKKSEQTIVNNGRTTEVKGSWMTGGTSGYSYPERGYFSYGLNMLTGFDFYMTKNLFVGYELLFGLTKIKDSKVEIDQTGGSSTPTIYPDLKGSRFKFGPGLNNGIRIGYVF